MGFALPKTHYHTAYAFNEILCSMSDVLFSNIIDKIQNSVFYGLMIDESTDMNSEKYLIIYVKYFDEKEGIVRTEFFKLTEIIQFDALFIFSLLKDFLKHHQLSLRFLTSFATDGASVMIGKQNGVATKIKEVNPFLIINHCCAHKLALTLKDSENIQEFI